MTMTERSTIMVVLLRSARWSQDLAALIRLFSQPWSSFGVWCFLGYWQKPCRREWKGSAQSFDRFLWKVNLGGKPNWSGPLKIPDLELKMLQIWGRRWSSAWKGVRGEFVLVLVCFSISRSMSKEKYPGSPWSTTPFWVWRLWSSTGPSVFPMLMPSNHERGHSDREACLAPYLAPVPMSPPSVCPISNSVRQRFL